MATQLFLRDTDADTHLGTNTAKKNGSASGWTPKALATTRGPGVVASAAVPTISGASTGIEITDSNPLPVEWLSPPVSADVTISGTITANIWMAESDMNANVFANVIIDIVRATDNSIVNIVQSTRATEAAVTTRAANNFTTGMASGGYTGQTVNRGDRIRIRIVGTASAMGASFTFNASWAGTSAAADGDSYVTFTETFSFASEPAGSKLYFTTTASAVSTASVDYEVWTTSGTVGVSSDFRTNVAGWTAPLQLQDTAGGTVVDFFTQPLAAFTLGGKAVVKVWPRVSFAGVIGSLRCELARVAGDGTSPTVWASWCIAPTGNTDWGQLTTTATQRTVNLSGDDLAISDGQRLRLRFYADDASNTPMTQPGSSRTTQINYDYSATPDANGDSYITLPQTVTASGPATLERSVSLVSG